jgi:hypothetical protein
MVEITYQMLLSTLQTAGILVGIFYYIMTIRTNQRNQEIAIRNQELTLETRQAQLFMQWYHKFADATEGINTIAVLKGAKFETAEEWLKLMETDELFQKTWMAYGSFYEGLGVIVKEGLLNVRWVALMWGGATTRYWSLLEPVLKGLREYYDYPRMASEAEYVCKEVIKYMDEHPELKT